MKIQILAALAATLCHAQIATAGDRPDHDRAIERAAIAILQTKLPDFRKGLDIDQEVVMAHETQGAMKPDALSALLELGNKPALTGRIIWL